MGIATSVIIITVGITLLIMTLLLVILIHKRKMLEKDQVINEKEITFQKELLNASLEMAEQERNKIASNIHDDIGMALHVMKVNVSKMKRNLDDKRLIEDVLNDTDSLIMNTISITRILSYDLMPPTLISSGFIEGIEYLAKYIASTKILEVEFKTEKERVPMDERTKLHLYRLVKEIFNNIIKHTKASKAEILISFKENVMNIVIEHNGKGITNDAVKRLTDSSKGIGLKNIIGRSQLINASVQYAIIDEHKSKVIIEVPIR